MRQCARAALSRRGAAAVPRLLADLLVSVPREWAHTLKGIRVSSWINGLTRDVRYALRLLVRSPGFTAAAVITLALGIGANTAMFSLADATLLRPIRVAAPERLVSWTWTSAYPDFLSYTGRGDVFDGVMAWSGGSRLSVVVEDASELTSAMFVSGNTFNVLGVVAAAGRLL